LASVLERVFNALIENPDFQYLITGSTIVRAHQHAAAQRGQRRGGDRRSRGGLRTKISAGVDAFANRVRL
jgi:hypothetical protein